MKLEHTCEIGAPLSRVWAALTDLEQVARCLPGASLDPADAEGAHAGEFRVKIGPTAAAYGGKLRIEDVDPATHTLVLHAAGTDKRGQGGARSTVTAVARETQTDATRLTVSAEYQVTGRLARFARGGTIDGVAAGLLDEFAAALGARLTEDQAPAPVAAAPPAPASPAPFETTGPEPTAPEPRPAAGLDASGRAAEARARAIPLAALVLGFLLALRVLRRRN